MTATPKRSGQEPKKEKMRRMMVQFPVSQIKALKAEAKRRGGESVASIVREMVRDAMEAE